MTFVNSTNFVWILTPCYFVADILSEVAQQNPGLRIGVLASGPTDLVHTVVSQCRRSNGIISGGQNGAFFDLHTISYVL